MSEPTIVGNRKPHTVSLPEGSSVATSRRKAEVTKDYAVPEAAEPAADLPPPVESDPPEARLEDRAEPAVEAPPAEPAPPEAPASLLDEPLDFAFAERIAEVERRNQSTRAALDALPARRA